MTPDQQLVHVTPLNDLKEHILSADCPCNPRIEDGVCIHNSWDGREGVEQWKEILDKSKPFE